MQPLISVCEACAPFYAGIDVGGTNTKIGLLDDQGATIAFESIPTNEQQGPQQLLADAAETVKRMAAERSIAWDQLRAAGLGTPGPMDIPGGRILDPTNLPHWRFYNVRDALSAALGLPVAFSNDANAAAFGEFWVGSGKQWSSLIMLTLGTGVGGGIIVEGQAIEGTNSFGAECGHVLVDSREDARLCVWGGGRGELEAYASASAVSARAEQWLDQGRDSSLAARRASGEEITALMLSEEAERGDPLCLEVILEAARYLGIGLVSLVHTIDPGVVILGGAMNFGGPTSAVGRQFLDAVRTEFKRRAFDVVANNTVIEFASLGGDAGYIGAAGLGRALAQGQR